MRIWAFPSFYPYDHPGLRWTGIFAHRQYKGLIENGADLKVIIPVKWKPLFPFSELSGRWSANKVTYPQYREYDGIKIFHPRIPNLLPYILDKRSYKEKYYAALARFFKDQNIDLKPGEDIFFSQWLPESDNVQYAAHRFGIRSAILAIGDDVVVWPHTSQGHLKVFDKLMTEADIRFMCADYLGKETNKILGKNLAYEVAKWGVEYDIIKPLPATEKLGIREKYDLPTGRTLILCIGSAIVRKGWLDLFDAFNIIRKTNDDIGLVAVHAGFDELNLDEEAAKRNLTDIFYNLKEIPPEQINGVLNAVDIFCLPSHWEGLANANIEAMSAGLPVITTDVCGHPELITSGKNGFLVPPKQPAILAEKLLQLINDQNLRIDMGKTAREFIVTLWGSFADNGKTLYDKLK